MPINPIPSPLASISLHLNPYYKRDTPAQVRALQRRQERRNETLRADVRVAYDREHHFEYYGQVMVGTPYQALRLGFDTGSSDIWFGTKACLTKACTGSVPNRQLFNQSASKTFETENRVWNVNYKEPWKNNVMTQHLSASGTVGSDIIYLGNIAVRQTVGLANDMSEAWLDRGIDGRFGLGWGSEATGLGGSSFAENVLNTTLVVGSAETSKFIVSVILPSAHRRLGTDGNILFGTIDSSRYTGDLHTIPVTPSNGNIKIDGLKINNTPTNYTASGVFRSSHSFLGVQDTIAKHIHSMIPRSRNEPGFGGWLVPCDLVENTKGQLTLQMNGKDFHVPFASLVMENEKQVIMNSTYCISGVQGGFEVWSIGDVFMKDHYFVFQYDSAPSISIAPVKR
ncbi:hypothetical protein EC991_007089 [Linnemannia zychae]|nr:hypothetical protein EC991_007089 [Linnemannia zychae]